MRKRQKERDEQSPKRQRDGSLNSATNEQYYYQPEISHH